MLCASFAPLKSVSLPVCTLLRCCTLPCLIFVADVFLRLTFSIVFHVRVLCVVFLFLHAVFSFSLRLCIPYILAFPSSSTARFFVVSFRCGSSARVLVRSRLFPFVGVRLRPRKEAFFCLLCVRAALACFYFLTPSSGVPSPG
ncbi:hypothetical protein TRVL_05456 [Trypanosoma vivax]|nr:hypothetical protein TRVL_05456 [Trypanosoma vivax]